VRQSACVRRAPSWLVCMCDIIIAHIFCFPNCRHRFADKMAILLLCFLTRRLIQIYQAVEDCINPDDLDIAPGGLSAS
jgi:hypothetical protein